MTMSKKHYNMIAGILNHQYNLVSRSPARKRLLKCIALEMAAKFSDDNPRFITAQFMDAVVTKRKED